MTIYTDITEHKAQRRAAAGAFEELSEQVFENAERLASANRALAATNAALEEAKRELIAIEARTRQVTEMMPAHIAHVDHDLRYTFSNHRLLHSDARKREQYRRAADVRSAERRDIRPYSAVV